MGKTYAPTISLNVVEDKLDDIIEKLGGTPATVTEPSAAEFSAPGLEARLVQIADLVSEGGTGGSGGLVVESTVESDTMTLGTTYADIVTALEAGTYVTVKVVDEEIGGTIFFPIYSYAEGNGTYTVDVYMFESGGVPFTADAEDGYPSATMSNPPSGDNTGQQ